MKPKKRTVGRPLGSKIPKHLKRNKMSGIRIQQRMLDWLKAQPESGGKIIEWEIARLMAADKNLLADLESKIVFLSKQVADRDKIVERYEALIGGKSDR